MPIKHETKPLSVLFICSILPPYTGGAALQGSNIISTFSEKFKNEFKQINVITEKGCTIKSDNTLKIQSILFNYDSVSNQDKSFIKQLINYLIVIFNILFTKKDIIHIHSRYVYAKYIGKIIWLSLLLSPSKVIIDIQDRFYNNFRFGHNFVVCSEELLEYYSWLKRKFFIPMPAKFPKIEDKRFKHKVAYFGEITSNKGVIELINGYKKYLKDTDNPLELHFYGSNTLGEIFKEMIKNIAKIKYLGVIPHNRIFDKILEYKAVILPSKFEGLPRICLETMYCNRIIVCHKSIKQITPYLSDQFILDDIAPEYIKGALYNIESYDKQITYKYDFSIHLPENTCKKLINLYQQVIK